MKNLMNCIYSVSGVSELLCFGAGLLDMSFLRFSNRVPNYIGSTQSIQKDQILDIDEVTLLSDWNRIYQLRHITTHHGWFSNSLYLQESLEAPVNRQPKICAD